MVNKEFMAKRNELIKKYFDNISIASSDHNVDVGIAFEMLLANVRSKEAGLDAQYAVGAVDYAELEKDIAELDALRRK